MNTIVSLIVILGFFYIILILPFQLLLRIKKNYTNTKKVIKPNSVSKGKIGESNVFRTLVYNNENHLLKNIYVFKENKTSTEIDIICINEYGIFVYESKNYSGWIFGDENESNWIQTFKNGKKFYFYNPIKQNENHIKYLKQYLNIDKCKFYSVIVFNDECTFKNLHYNQSNYTLIKLHELYNYIQFYRNNYKKSLDQDEIEKIYNKLKNNYEQHFNTNNL
ncbi:MAG: nuclease-related domain-containing protein [Clostridiales bacterium]